MILTRYTLFICNENTTTEDDRDYIPFNDENDMGWLGYFIGNSTSLKEFYFVTQDIHDLETLCGGMHNNRSIMNICFNNCINRLNGNIFGMLDQFFKNNHKLTKFVVEDCELGSEGVRHLSLALGSCNKSLKHFILDRSEIGGGHLVEIILALSIHPQLERLSFRRMNVGRNECTALATPLRSATKHLQTLDLGGNNIDDEGVDALVNAIDGSQLQVLDLSRDLSHNPTITAKGWKTVSSLLERTHSNLQKLTLRWNNLGDGGALIFANALRGNSTLEYLDLYGNGNTDDGWAHFSKLLCDTSTVNNTYLSNHTLRNLVMTGYGSAAADVQSYLQLNRRSRDKGRVAMNKILQHHEHFNLQPFFEWEFKVLPLLIGWLKKASTGTTAYWLAKNRSLDTIFLFLSKIRRTKLSCMYEFVREFPMLYVGPITRKEIEECSATEIQLLLGDDTIHNASQLEKVQQRKTRAMRRLF